MRIILKLTVILLFLNSSSVYADTIDFYKIYYNDSLIFHSNIGLCPINVIDSDNLTNHNPVKFDIVRLNQIDSNSILRIEYFRDYWEKLDSLIFLELQTDNGKVLKNILTQ